MSQNSSNNNHSTDQQDSDYQFPNARRIYKEGSRPDLRVPLRELTLNVTRNATGQIEPGIGLDCAFPQYADSAGLFHNEQPAGAVIGVCQKEGFVEPVGNKRQQKGL